MGRTKVGVREVRQNLSQYLERIARGEAFEITRRDKTVAVLDPPEGQESLRARLLSEGKLIPATHPGREIPAPLGGLPPSGPILDDLREDTV
jgi:antitoxin (DNA-binding transcriptional repressor) of toxin-antitoxin stability system